MQATTQLKVKMSKSVEKKKRYALPKLLPTSFLLLDGFRFERVDFVKSAHAVRVLPVAKRRTFTSYQRDKVSESERQLSCGVGERWSM
jgi:hypothetical protein